MSYLSNPDVSIQGNRAVSRKTGKLLSQGDSYISQAIYYRRDQKIFFGSFLLGSKFRTNEYYAQKMIIDHMQQGRHISGAHYQSSQILIGLRAGSGSNYVK